MVLVMVFDLLLRPVFSFSHTATSMFELASADFEFTHKTYALVMTISSSIHPRPLESLSSSMADTRPSDAYAALCQDW